MGKLKMDQKEFPEIITERLLLRRLEESDWEMIAYLRSDKDLNRYVKRPRAESMEKALEFISKINTEIVNQSSYYWAITEKDKNVMIGSICLWNFSEDKKIAEVGYDLSPEFHKKGIMNESLGSVLDFGFARLRLKAIKAFTHKQNERSRKLLIRNGFNLLKGEKDKDNLDNLVYEIKKPIGDDVYEE